jgi:1,4-alpha-glucan branching enzyme
MPATKPPVAVRKKPGAKRIPFTVKVGEAREVALAGDFNGWTPSTALKRFEDGAWTVILELLPGEYQYRLVVDGQWRDHADAQRRVPNPFGTENCVLIVA